MISLAQMVLTVNEQSAPWKALRIFTYCSITANLGAAGCAIWATIYLAWIPLRFKFEEDRNRRRIDIRLDYDQISYQEKYRWAIDLVRDTPNFYRQYSSAVAWYGIGLILTFLAVATWAWLSMSSTEAIAVLVFVVLGAIITTLPLFNGLYQKVNGHPWMF